MPLEDYSLIRLSDDHNIKPFNCDDADLNGFLLDDAKSYMRKLLAVTYLMESESQTVAFFSLLNDKITIDDATSKSQWRKIFERPLPHRKRFKSYPAMKIARLGVDIASKGLGIGTMIIDFLKTHFIDGNRTGCMFITVDAYKNSLGFYEKNGFYYITEADKNEDTRLMFFDLRTLLPSN